MIWPADIAVPPRPILGPRFAPGGAEEGAVCGRAYDGERYCQGRLELRSSDGSGCYCGATMAPCGSCESMATECPRCGWREEERWR